MPEINIDITIENAAPEVEVVLNETPNEVSITVGIPTTISDALLIANRLGEFSTEEAKAEARANLGLEEAGIGDMLKSVYDTNDDGVVNAADTATTATTAATATFATTAGTANAVTWNNVSGKPSTFPPSAHTHVANDVTDFQSAVSANTDVTANTSARHEAVTLSGTPNYITIVGQAITRALIDLTAHVTGRLPFANLASGSAHSVVGRAGSGNGDVGNISAGNDTVLRRSGSGNVGFGGVETNHIDNDAVTNAKAANMAVNTIKGRISTGTGDPEDLTAANVRTIINVANGATANDTDANLKNRANHTGTQTASTISDFQTTVSSNSDVTANTAARHAAVTVTDSTEIDFTLTGQNITASIKNASVAASKLDSGVTTSLGKADTALQSGANVSTLTNDANYRTSVQVGSLTLTQGSWSLVSGLYEYDLSNANITASSIVDVIPDNADIDIVKDAEVLPRTESGSGTVKLFAVNAPTGDIGVTINIWK